jgi:hypothetical protein
MEKKMSEPLRMQQSNTNPLAYRLVDKNGNVVEDKTFDNFDSLADFMMEQAEKYYQGLVDPDTTVEMTAFDNTGKVLYQDQASYTNNDTGTGTGTHQELESILTELVNERTEDSDNAAGFGET